MNLLLTIRSLFRREGTDAAKADLTSVRQQARIAAPSIEEIKGSSEGAARGIQNLDKAGKGGAATLADMHGKVRRLTESMTAAEAATRGGTQSLAGFGRILLSLGVQFGGVLTWAGLILGVGTAAYRAGRMLDEWLGISSRITRLVGESTLLGNAIGNIAARIREADQTSLDRLTARLEFLQDVATEVSAALAKGTEREAKAAQSSGAATAANIRASNVPGQTPDQREAAAKDAELRGASAAASIRLQAAEQELRTRQQMETEIRREWDATIKAREAVEKKRERSNEQIKNDMFTNAARRLGEMPGSDRQVPLTADPATLRVASMIRTELEGIANREAVLARKWVELSGATQEAANKVRDLGFAADEAKRDMERQKQIETRERQAKEAEAFAKGEKEQKLIAADAGAAARAARERAQFDQETPERQLNYLRNRGRAILAEARGEMGPVSPTRRDELAAEYYALRKQAKEIEANQQAAKERAPAANGPAPAGKSIPPTVAGQTSAAKPAAPAARIPTSASVEEVLARGTDVAVASRGNAARRALDVHSPIVRYTPLITGNMRTFGDSRRDAARAATVAPRAKRDPQEETAANTRDSKALLEKIERSLQPPRK